jgi:hypothetical protein
LQYKPLAAKQTKQITKLAATKNAAVFTPRACKTIVTIFKNIRFNLGPSRNPTTKKTTQTENHYGSLITDSRQNSKRSSPNVRNEDTTESAPKAMTTIIMFQ